MSMGFSLARLCASVRCSARAGTVNSGTCMAWVMRRPCLRIASTCSGQGSMKVTSSPACTICAPQYPPTAPAPTIAILAPIGTLRLPLFARQIVPHEAAVIAVARHLLHEIGRGDAGQRSGLRALAQRLQGVVHGAHRGHEGLMPLQGDAHAARAQIILVVELAADAAED